MGLDRTDAQIAVNGAYAQAEAFVAANVQDFEPDQVEAVAAVVDSLGRAFARNRLAAHEDITSDYPERKRAGGGGGGTWKKGSSSGGGGGTGAISDKQKKLINQLLEEKVGAEALVKAAGGVDALTSKDASSLITELFALERVDD